MELLISALIKSGVLELSVNYGCTCEKQVDVSA